MKRRVLAAVLCILLLAGCTARKETAIRSFTDLNDPGITIGTATGSASEAIVRSTVPQAQVKLFDTVVDGCAAVEAGKLDAFVFDKTLLGFYARSNPNTTLMEDTLGEPVYICGAVRLEDAGLQGQVNELLDQFRQDGTLQDLCRRWLESEDPAMPNLQPPEHPQGTLRVLTEGMSPPFNYVGDNGMVTGLDVELGIRLAYAMNMDVTFEMMAFGSLIAGLETGKGDIILSDMNATPERAENVRFTDPYATAYAGVLIRSALLAQPGEETGDDDSPRSLGEWLSDFVHSLQEKFIATFITEQRWKLVVNGLAVTLEIALLAFALATVWGAALLAMARCRWHILQLFAAAFQKIVAGTPILVVLLLLFFVVFRGDTVPAMAVAILGFGLYYGAPLAEVFRTGIDSVDKGEREAALALGFRPRAVFRKIVLPQAVNRVFGLYQGQLVSLVKATSIVAYISIQDLTKAGDIIRSRTYDAFFPIVTTALIYMAVISLITFLLGRVGLRLDPKKRPRTLKGVNCR